MSLSPPPGLTTSQAATWLEQQYFPGLPIFNTGQVLTIPGPLRIGLFRAALEAAIAESPGLRLPSGPAPHGLDLPVLDLAGDADPEAAAEAWMQAEMARPFPPGETAPYRFALLRTGGDATLWFQKYHHIVIDALGQQRLSARVAARYRALRAGDEPPPLEAAAPAAVLAAEQAYAASPAYAADRAWWLERLRDPPPPLVEAPPQLSERGRSGLPRRLRFSLPAAAMRRLEAQAAATGATACGAFLLLVHCAFARLHDQQDIVLGLALGNRTEPGTEAMVGLLMRHMPLRLAPDPALPVGEALRQAERIRRRDYRHRRFPVRDLGVALGGMRQARRALYDVLVNYLPTPYEFGFEAGPVVPRNLSRGFDTPWTVTLTDTGAGRAAEVTIDSDPGLVGAESAACLAAALRVLLLEGLEDPARSLGRLPVMSAEMRAEALALAEGERRALPQDETLASLCAAQAARTPEAVALICGEERISHAALHARAGRLARQLAALGVRPDVVVGIALPRTAALVTTVLAVHKAGGAYLPLDPAYPPERIRFIVQDSRCAAIVTTTALAPRFAGSGAHLLLLDAPEGTPAEAEPVPPGPGDLAYVLYTSGSTGQPKGVGVEHRNLANLMAWGVDVIPAEERAGMLLSTSLNFDISAFELFLPLACGGTVILVENLLAARQAPAWPEIRLIDTGPSVLQALLRTGDLPPRLASVILVGEALPRHLADRIFATAPDVRLLNFYGPTETTVYSSWAEVDPRDRAEPAIGRPLLNTTLHVLDAAGELLPPGMAGELYIGGAGVARGYLGRPELTGARFLPDPFGPGRLYRTGDRARWRADGLLEFLGRADDQIKINGMRVEPGEIEAAMLARPGIAGAVVALREDTAGTRRLVAYAVAAPGAARETEALRAALERALPPHMVPAHILWLDALPLTPNGKLDRKALPPPPADARAAPVDRPPETPVEQALAAIWETVLQAPAPGVMADFYEQGGDSLALLNLVAAIEARFGRYLGVDSLTGHLSIARLARLLAAEDVPEEEDGSLVTLQPLGSGTPFFCVHSIGGNVTNLRALAGLMGTERPFLGLRWTPADGLGDDIERMAARYVAAVRARQPAGPYFLGGYSMGAAVAFEMARQLAAQGERIGLLAAIDTRWKGWRLSARNVLPAFAEWLANLSGWLRHEAAQPEARRLAGKLRRGLRRALRRVRGLPPDIGVALGADTIDARWHPLFEAHLRAVAAYRPQPHRLPVEVFRATVQPLSFLCNEAALGWSATGEGEVPVHTVPGDHEAITREPCVHHLAAELSEVLRRREAGLRAEASLPGLAGA